MNGISMDSNKKLTVIVIMKNSPNKDQSLVNQAQKWIRT